MAFVANHANHRTCTKGILEGQTHSVKRFLFIYSDWLDVLSLGFSSAPESLSVWRAIATSLHFVLQRRLLRNK